MNKTDYDKLRDEAIERKFANIQADKTQAATIAQQATRITELTRALSDLVKMLDFERHAYRPGIEAARAILSRADGEQKAKE